MIDTLLTETNHDKMTEVVTTDLLLLQQQLPGATGLDNLSSVMLDNVTGKYAPQTNKQVNITYNLWTMTMFKTTRWSFFKESSSMSSEWFFFDSQGFPPS